jgi:CHAT domain-containing protein
MKTLRIIPVTALLVLVLIGNAFGQTEKEAEGLLVQGYKTLIDGKFWKAFNYFVESRDLSLQIGRFDCVAENELAIGKYFFDLGQYDTALSHYEEALSLYRKYKFPVKEKAGCSYQGSAFGEARCLNNIGGVYVKQGRYEDARSYYKKAEMIQRDFGDPYYVANCLNNIGEAYLLQGLYDKALIFYGQAKKIWGDELEKQKHKKEKDMRYLDGYALALYNIGDVYFHMRHLREAIHFQEESVQIRKENNIRRFLAEDLSGLGFLYLILQNYEKAEQLFKEADKARGDMMGIVGVNTAFVELYLARGEFDKANSLLEKMPIRWSDAPPVCMYKQTLKGLALKGQGNLSQASHTFHEAVKISEEMRHKVKEREGFLGAGFGSGRIRAYRGLVETLAERAIRGGAIEGRFVPYGKNLASAAFYFAELMKARTLLEAIAESTRGYSEPTLPEGLRKKEHEILNRLSAIENNWETAYRGGEETFRKWEEQKEFLQRDLTDLVSRLRQDPQYARYAALKYPGPPTAEHLLLREDEVLLEYALGDSASYLFRVQPGQDVKVFRIPEGKQTLENRVRAFLSPLQRTSTKEGFSPALGKKLYSLLLEEALQDLPREKKLIIVPDGILGLVPFEALVMRRSKYPWIFWRHYKNSVYAGDYWNIAHSQSAAILALNRMTHDSLTSKPLFALGDPIYDKEDPLYRDYEKGKALTAELRESRKPYCARTPEGGEICYPALPDTGQEVLAIARLFNIQPNPPDVLLLLDANETHLKKVSLKDYRFLHFSTHADLGARVQGIKEPFLLLGQVENQEGDDGFLTFTEVLELELNADMVVLSACSTGSGERREGEGVLNFARAFQQAGAKSVLVSLWDVDSEMAVLYMKMFYTYLTKGKGRAEALRLARQNIKKRYPNPFYWAVFMLYGEG